jgi:NitT/TauT family transport system ATP-binding protein
VGENAAAVVGAPASPGAAFLQLDHVSKTYTSVSGREVQALGDVSLGVARGEFVSIVGPSGCGKTTLLDIVADLQKSSSGGVSLNGRPVNPQDMRVSVVFQEDSIFPWRRVLSNVAFGLQSKGVDKATRERKSKELLQLVGLEGFEHNYPAELSGGMRQRVAIARALALDPELLLMDEPFGALDEQTRFALGLEVQRIWMQTGITVLLITHSINEALFLSDRVIVLSGRPSRVLEDIRVPFQRPRTVETMSDPEFGALVTRIYEALGTEASAVDVNGGA